MKILKNLFLTLIFIISLKNHLFANSIKIVFTTEIEPICGLEILKPNGNINFNDSKINDEAEFLIRTNNTSNYAKVNFTNIVKSKNIINENGYFKINNSEKFYWNHAKELLVQNEILQKISANIDKNSNQIEAGEAAISTVIQLKCQ